MTLRCILNASQKSVAYQICARGLKRFWSKAIGSLGYIKEILENSTEPVTAGGQTLCGARRLRCPIRAAASPVSRFSMITIHSLTQWPGCRLGVLETCKAVQSIRHSRTLDTSIMA